MNKEKFSEKLKTLHNELKDTEYVDDNERDLLDAVKDDIKKLIGRLDDEDPRGSGRLVERLKEAIFNFEDSHPSLSSSLKQIVDALSSIGI